MGGDVKHVQKISNVVLAQQHRSSGISEVINQRYVRRLKTKEKMYKEEKKRKNRA